MWGPYQQICSLLYLELQPRAGHVLGMVEKPFSKAAPGAKHHIFGYRVAQVMARKVCLECVLGGNASGEGQ